ncbi:hypothetical protein B296_00053746 [Ensete ventricosum]|uniref:Acyl-CoA oxidase C-terminal domain-containing protein n=1 Tax=Ensete ventricosum TaxID=4639 RepID=A0A426WYB6_ENSVE|nr:hypothetical protein B296_00053746 [Ensete ventricosum]
MDPSSSAARRTAVLAGHLLRGSAPADGRSSALIEPAACLQYSPPELSEKPPAFDTASLRRVLDGHDIEGRDWLFRLMEESPLFCPHHRGGRTFVAPDYNQTMEQQREVTMRRIEYLLAHGVFEGWLTGSGPEALLRKFAFFEVPRENLLNSVADVLPDGRYVSSVENPDQVTSISKLSIFDVLGLLRSMYALICTEEDASFLRYGYLSLDSAAAARKEVMKLCYDLRPHALSVVSSFGIPDAFLSPIAFDWVEANSWSSLNEE